MLGTYVTCIAQAIANESAIEIYSKVGYQLVVAMMSGLQNSVISSVISRELPVTRRNR